MTMFVKFMDILKRLDWGGSDKKRRELADYRRIEHLDDPTYDTKGKRFKVQDRLGNFWYEDRIK